MRLAACTVIAWSMLVSPVLAEDADYVARCGGPASFAQSMGCLRQNWFDEPLAADVRCDRRPTETLDDVIYCGKWESDPPISMPLAQFARSNLSFNDGGMWQITLSTVSPGTPLHEDLRARGFTEPEEMALAMLTSLWLANHRCPMKLDEQAAYYRVRRTDPTTPAPHLDCTVPEGSRG